MEAVESSGLSKNYHNGELVEALKSVNLSIPEGNLFTLLGQNGAGKTTFLRIISTQLLPTTGQASILGFDVASQPNEVRRHIAVVPQDVATYGNYTPWEYCYYFSLLRGMSKQQAKETSEKALKAVELWDLRHRTCATLSIGEKKRAIISSALASDADVYMLDEPTSGLDALARRNVWAVLREMVDSGKTILLTTHIMEEAELISDRLAILHRGSVIAQGTPEEVKNLSKDKFRVLVEGNIDGIGLTQGRKAVRFGNKHVIYLKDEDDALELVRKALKKGLKAEASLATLEDTFVKLLGEEQG